MLYNIYSSIIRASLNRPYSVNRSRIFVLDYPCIMIIQLYRCRTCIKYFSFLNKIDNKYCFDRNNS